MKALNKILAGAVLAVLLMNAVVFAAGSSKKSSEYPDATRSEPKLDLSDERELKRLNDGLDAAVNGDKDKAEQLLKPIIDGSKSKYAQALALQGMANLVYSQGEHKGAIDYLKRALDNGVLPNEAFFQLEYELAQFYLVDEQYDKVLETIAKWRTEGRKESADSYALEANAYYKLGKYPEAIAAMNKAISLTDKPQDSWQQILMASYSESGQGNEAVKVAQALLAANPNDSSARNNAVTVMLQAQKYPEAIQLLEKAYASADFNERDYINLAKLYLLTGQESSDPGPNAGKATQVLQEGINKGIVSASFDNYKLLGDAALLGQQNDAALAAYQKALPMAKDGEVAYRVGQLYYTLAKYAQAKPFVEQAIDQGMPHKGQAYMLLAEVKRQLKDRPGAVTAMREAAKDPETAAKAKTWLKQAGVGK